MASSKEETEVKLRKLFKNIKRRFKQLGVEYVVARTPNAILFCSEYPNTKKRRKKKRREERRGEKRGRGESGVSNVI